MTAPDHLPYKGPLRHILIPVAVAFALICLGIHVALP